MKNFTLFRVMLCSMIVFSACSKDDIATKKEIKLQDPDPIENARLMTMSVTTNSQTDNYSYIYDGDQLKQIIRSGGFNNDTSFFEYYDSTIINISKSLTGDITNVDTIYVTDGKKSKVVNWRTDKLEYETFEYENDYIKTYRKIISSIPYTYKKTYFTTILDSNTLYFTKMGSVLSAASDRYYVHLSDGNKIDSMIRRLVVSLSDEVKEKFYYTYTTNQITVEKYTVFVGVSTLTNKEVLTIDNSMNKIIKVERFDASNVKYYEENRTYIEANSNLELLLYNHPMENPVVLLKPYY